MTDEQMKELKIHMDKNFIHTLVLMSLQFASMIFMIVSIKS